MLQASCKLLMFVHLYLLSCNYFWMLCEGIYLHTLIVVAVFAEKQHLLWYYLLGWGEWNSSSTETQANVQKQRCHGFLIGLLDCRISTCAHCASFSSSTLLLQRHVRARVVLQSLSKHFLKCPLVFFWNVLMYWLTFVYCVIRWGDVLTDVGSALTRRCCTSSTDPSALRWWWDQNTWVQIYSPALLIFCWNVVEGGLKAGKQDTCSFQMEWDQFQTLFQQVSSQDFSVVTVTMDGLSMASPSWSWRLNHYFSTSRGCHGYARSTSCIRSLLPRRVGSILCQLVLGSHVAPVWPHYPFHHPQLLSSSTCYFAPTGLVKKV